MRRMLWVLTAGLWAGLFIATHLPAHNLPDVAVSDKFMHFIAYFGLASMIYISTWITNPARRWTGSMVLAIAVVYGIIDEVLQPFVGRHADVKDWVYDVAGAACAVVLLVMIRRIVTARPRHEAKRAYDLSAAPAES